MKIIYRLAAVVIDVPVVVEELVVVEVGVVVEVVDDIAAFVVAGLVAAAVVAGLVVCTVIVFPDIVQSGNSNNCINDSDDDIN